MDQEPLRYPLDPPVDDNSRDDPDFIGPGENNLHAKLIKDLIKARRLADAFWQTFRDEVLLELRNRGIDDTQTPTRRSNDQSGRPRPRLRDRRSPLRVAPGPSPRTPASLGRTCPLCPNPLRYYQAGN
ncbi:hypothetical protein AAVH_24238 [Aphelenchoides avenae]|nr:hypothetical protein AAVH_24238 [Aphelenchus avenae]